jgi:hypothetical protein
MGFAVTEGLTLNHILMPVNVENVKANKGILQTWLGNIIYADYLNFKLKKLQLALGSTHTNEGKLGWKTGDSKTRISILLKKPEIIVNPDGSKELRL